MTTEQNIYLQILAYDLTKEASITPPNVDAVNWFRFYSFCESQAILGIGLQCIDKLKKIGQQLEDTTEFASSVDRNFRTDKGSEPVTQ